MIENLMGQLTAKFIQNAKAGRHGDGNGLYLLVKMGAARISIVVPRLGRRTKARHT
ncbi:DUF4102 domain-containing protein [Sphingopyxis witflariensis]|uniref:DUF4102 domain-containing protein n=1 Tax=Sphingopyxis witflariensis TaxID=173675 RepID=UPI00157DD629|nr:DUF4102 domain-containing protein [Sphingopyxis witflariensis]